MKKLTIPGQRKLTLPEPEKEAPRPRLTLPTAADPPKEATKPRLTLPGASRPPQPPAKPRLSLPFQSMYLTPDVFKVTTPYPAKRKLTQSKGLICCPLADALPDPNFPHMKVNLEILKWATVLNGKIVFCAPTKTMVLEWANKIETITDGRIMLKN